MAKKKREVLLFGEGQEVVPCIICERVALSETIEIFVTKIYAKKLKATFGKAVKIVSEDCVPRLIIGGCGEHYQIVRELVVRYFMGGMIFLLELLRGARAEYAMKEEKKKS